MRTLSAENRRTPEPAATEAREGQQTIAIGLSRGATRSSGAKRPDAVNAPTAESAFR
jgi:hypothetical protein